MYKARFYTGGKFAMQPRPAGLRQQDLRSRRYHPADELLAPARCLPIPKKLSWFV